jgi:hypothetical protein
LSPQCTSYYEKLEQAVGLGAGAPADERLALYRSFLVNRPRAHAPKRLPLFFLEGDSLRRELDAYLRSNIRKGMTPVFRNVRKLCVDSTKAAMMRELAEGYVVLSSSL